jgi:pSer/pThr/pTyr-binding forkhead associated (FHA) protein
MGGAPMMPPPAQISAPARVPMGSTVNCPRCSTATPIGFAYCQQCGLHMQGMQPTDPSQSLRAKPPSRPPPIAMGGPMIDPMAGTLAQPDAARAAIVGARASAPSVQPLPQGTPPLSVVPRPGSASGGQWGFAVLVNRDGTDGQRFPLASDDIVIGRAGADIAFDDDRFLARQHARLTRTPDGITLHPLDAINGVFKKTDGPTDLADGAIILLGREVLRFERVVPEERQVTPLVRHGVSLFGSPPRDPWGRVLQLIPSGGVRDVRHLVGDEVVLGREEGDIVFRDDAFMSRRHAALTWDGTRARITDLGSSNGSFVRLTGQTTIKPGDHVRLGDQLLRIER